MEDASLDLGDPSWILRTLYGGAQAARPWPLRRFFERYDLLLSPTLYLPAFPWPGCEMTLSRQQLDRLRPDVESRPSPYPSPLGAAMILVLGVWTYLRAVLRQNSVRRTSG